ncbi:HAD family hydrolase [Phenylobacterium sp.]|uniref:HAD family hydrolase n=1 Tax=Phenylobacterium sp. TaxID=1871053 RepID=UPI000C8FF805|nr:HAD family hydrolase [Phenylobacterium sp.]MAK82396.1 phosphoserine phosphatase [Phenylobacterium sp.]
MAKKLIPMAIAYDFDGTLADGNMQEHQFLPDIGMKPKAFWEEVKRLTKEHQADEVLVYMNLMLRRADAAGVPVRRGDFKARGQAITLFEGVEGWFDRITAYGRAKGVRIEHVLVSSGNAEIFAGTPIASKFSQVYASKFMFDQNGVAAWPALAVNYTTKTQYLFRINKGAHDLSDNTKVNQFVEKKDRPVPFENMVFIGDGSTDIPCFRTVKEQGGLSIAVFKPNTKGAKSKADKYISDGRVHCALPANYSADGELDRVIKAAIDAVSARSALTSMFPEAGW